MSTISFWRTLKERKIVKRLRKSALYYRIRQYLPMPDTDYVDDRGRIEDAEVVTIDWPQYVEKPRVGIVRDYGQYPRWTKYCRFLDNSSFEYGIYDIHSHNWIEAAARYDVIVGFPSSALFHLEEMQRKYYVLEMYLGKTCYPSTDHVILYEDKIREAYLAKLFDIPFVGTYVSYDERGAMQLVESLSYPIVCKIVPSSGSVGMELVRTKRRGRKIVRQAFSSTGRKTHMVYFRQKDSVYFQDYVPNDGYDIRVIVIGNWAFGYYRKVLPGDFRASGMDLVEKRALPAEAMRIARKVNRAVGSPMLVVDMLHGLDGRYYLIEFSPICQIETSEQLHVDDVPGVYIFEDDETFYFEEGKYWVHELTLKGFLLNDYLPAVLATEDYRKSSRIVRETD